MDNETELVIQLVLQNWLSSTSLQYLKLAIASESALLLTFPMSCPKANTFTFSYSLLIISCQKKGQQAGRQTLFILTSSVFYTF